jgi:hypothetical protein
MKVDDMSENTALVLMMLLALIWNIALWGGFLYVIIAMNQSWWLILVPLFFTVFPKSKSDE